MRQRLYIRHIGMSRHVHGRRSTIGASLDYDRQVTAELGQGYDTDQGDTAVSMFVGRGVVENDQR
jgi:hypothetical protein